MCSQLVIWRPEGLMSNLLITFDLDAGVAVSSRFCFSGKGDPFSDNKTYKYDPSYLEAERADTN